MLALNSQCTEVLLQRQIATSDARAEFQSAVSPRSKSDKEAAIGLLMAIIIRCFESLLSLVRAILPASRALAKLQSYERENEEKKTDTLGSATNFIIDIKVFWHMFPRRNYLTKMSVPSHHAHNKLPNISNSILLCVHRN